MRYATDEEIVEFWKTRPGIRDARLTIWCDIPTIEVLRDGYGCYQKEEILDQIELYYDTQTDEFLAADQLNDEQKIMIKLKHG